MNEILQHEIEPVSEHMAADEQAILIAAAPDDSNIALIRTGAAVGTTGHPDAQPLLIQPQPRKFAFKLIDDSRKRSLGFGKGQAASRHGRTGHT